MPTHVERAELPGIGVRHDIVTDEGRRLSVLNLRDGGRQLALADEDDPDRASETIALTDDEATALSEVLGGSLILTQLAGLREQAAGLSIEQIPVRADSPYVGRALGDQAPTRTRAPSSRSCARPKSFRRRGRQTCCAAGTRSSPSARVTASTTSSGSSAEADHRGWTTARSSSSRSAR